MFQVSQPFIQGQPAVAAVQQRMSQEQQKKAAESVYLEYKKKYFETLELRPEEQQQLKWVLEHPVRTPESAFRVEDLIHPEIPRALSRLQCLLALQRGGL